MESQSPPVGLFNNTIYKNTEHPFSPGDKLLLFSDGLFEEFNTKGEQFGEDRTYKVIKEKKDKNVKEIFNTIFDRVIAFCPDKKQNDDITIIGIE